MKKIFCFCVIIFAAFQLHAQDMSLYKKRSLIINGDTLLYRILFPENFVKGKKYPVIVFLHGIGERGTDNELQLLHGGDLFLRDSLRKNFPAIVIFPQCPPTTTWSDMRHDDSTGRYVLAPSFSSTIIPIQEMLIKKLVDTLIDNKFADSKRIYIGGLSMGGFGTYDMVLRYGNYFAAAFPICGQSFVDLMVKAVKNIPLWIFHGGKDDVVSVEPDRNLYKALMDEGDRKVKYTEYPDANHNSWDGAFAEPDLLPWLFAQKN
jgi:predicted peptidase